MFSPMQEQLKDLIEHEAGVANLGQLMYFRKFDADFTREMNRSVRAMLRAWEEGG